MVSFDIKVAGHEVSRSEKEVVITEGVPSKVSHTFYFIINHELKGCYCVELCCFVDLTCSPVPLLFDEDPA